jgi:hypothetical protein
MTPGHVVTKEGDTLRGFILDRNNKWAVSSVSFSSSPTGQQRAYSLSEISSMYLQTYDARYFSRSVEIDKKPIDMTQMEGDGTRKIVTETVLLERIAGGKLDLFEYLDENGKRHFFVQKDGGKTEELPYVKYLSKNGRLVEMPFYQGTLKTLTSDCSSLDYTPSTYDAKPLKRYVTQYNECMGDSNAPKKKQKSRLIPYVMVGAAFGHGAFHGSEINTFSSSSASNGRYSNTTGFVVGAGVELASARTSNRFLPGIQVVYQATGKTSRNVTSSGSGTVYTMDFTLLHVGASLKYFLTSGKTINPYLKINFSGVSQMKTESVRTSSLSPTRVFYEPKSFGFSSSGSLGAQWKKLSLEARYQDCVLPADHTAKANFSSMDVIFSVYFSK